MVQTIRRVVVGSLCPMCKVELRPTITVKGERVILSTPRVCENCNQRIRDRTDGLRFEGLEGAVNNLETFPEPVETGEDAETSVYVPIEPLRATSGDRPQPQDPGAEVHGSRPESAPASTGPVAREDDEAERYIIDFYRPNTIVPEFSHGCNTCHFLGTAITNDDARHELYFCDRAPDDPNVESAVLARYGNAFTDYTSGSYTNHPAIQLAVFRAYEEGRGGRSISDARQSAIDQGRAPDPGFCT